MFESPNLDPTQFYSEDDEGPSPVLVEENPDGSAIFDVSTVSESLNGNGKKEETDFYANLAEDMDEDDLKSLAIKLLELIKEDDDSRAEWLATVNLGLKYLGFKLEDFKGSDGGSSFSGSSACYDSSLATALITSYATARAELFPASGPCRSEIIGLPTEESENRGERVKDFLNLFLTKIVPYYYKDSEKLLLYTIFTGSGFRKVYQDPVLNRPDVRFIRPQDFIINHHTTSMMNADRMTEIFYLTRKEIKLRERSGEFIEDDLPDTVEEFHDENKLEKTIQKIGGYNPSTTKNKSLFKFYECHIELGASELGGADRKNKDKDKKSIQKPYIITINADTKKIVSVKRNWDKDDDTYKKNEFYIHYYYLPGFGLYSIGLAHLVGSNAIALTGILRQSIDAGVFSNFPGFLKKRGVGRQESNDLMVRPGEAVEVETGDLPIQECIMTLPYKEPSQVLAAMRQEIKADVDRLSSAVQSATTEVGSNAPVGTTLAVLEVANKVQSTVLRSLHTSLGQELGLLFNLFGKYLPDTPYPFAVAGKEGAIMRHDFSETVTIVPVSDPNVLTTTHRLILSDAIRNIANNYPDLHNMREVLYRTYRAMSVDNIDKLLLPEVKPISADALSENLYLQLGTKIKVSPEQDDEAHIRVHQVFIDENSGNDNLKGAILSASIHIQAHKAMRILKQMGHPALGDKLEEEQLLQIPEVQQVLSVESAHSEPERLQQKQQQQQQQAAGQIDPQQIMLADIGQRKEASHLKSEESKLRSETEAFKAQLKFESEQNKTSNEKEIAEEKRETELKIAQLKNTNNVE